jgi:biopolymer transport protein ExbB/TolQ
MEQIAKFMNEGGTFMWVLFGVGVLVLAVVLERAIFYFLMHRSDSGKLVANVSQAVAELNNEKALKMLEKGKTPVEKLLWVALHRFDSGMQFGDVQKGVEEVAIKEVPRLTQRLNLLNLAANVATLTGLLGTIFGLQVSFDSLKLAEGAEKATALANGISQAMNTTAMGLIVAIPAMILYTQLHNKQKRLVEDLDQSVVKFLGYLEKRMG